MDQNEKSVPNHETQKQETLLPEPLCKVLADMRKRDHYGNGVWFGPAEWPELCDRIETAITTALIEVAARTSIEAVRLTNEKWEREKTVAQNATVSGNVAMLRHALELCKSDMCRYCRSGAAANGLPIHCENGCETLRIAREALDAPARNCDIGTGDEQDERFEQFCGSQKCYDCPARTLDACELAWAQLPYVPAEKKGGAQ